MKRSKKKCELCSREISLSNYEKHAICCKTGKKHTKVEDSWGQSNGLYKCPICNKEFSKKGIGSHIWKHTDEGSNFKPRKNPTAWNKGLTKETDSRVLKNSLSSTKALKEKRSSGWKPNTKPNQKFLKELSIKQSTNNTGGRCKWFTVSDQKVQGTWERDLAIKMNSLKIKWEKVKVPVSYKDKAGKIRRYTPDFKLLEWCIYLEVKGYWWGDDREKMKLVMLSNPKLTIVIIEKQLFKNLLEVDVKDKFLNLINNFLVYPLATNE